MINRSSGCEGCPASYYDRGEKQDVCVILGEAISFWDYNDNKICNTQDFDGFESLCDCPLLEGGEYTLRKR